MARRATWLARTLATTTAVVTALTLAACGRAEEPAAVVTEPAETPDVVATAPADGPATGDLTVWAMGTEGDALGSFIQPWLDENPDVHVEVVPVPWTAAADKFQTAIAAGTTPDVAMMGTTWMAQYGHAFADVPADFDLSHFFPGSVATTEVGGRTVGVPWYVDTRVLYYRTDLAAEAGWDHAPETLDEFKQFLIDIKDHTDVDFPLRMQPSGQDAFQGSLWAAWSNGASLMNADGTEWTLDTPQMEESMAFVQSLFAEGLANPQADTTPGATESDFYSGRVAAVVEGPFLMGALNQLGGDEFSEHYATARIPSGTSSTSFVGGANLVVFEESDNKDAAWKLIHWLTEPDTQVAFYRQLGSLPSNELAWDNPELANDAKMKVFGAQLTDTNSPPMNDAWVQVSSEGDRALEQMVVGGQTPAEALATLQSRAESIGVN